MKYISSRTNPEIKAIAALDLARERYAQGQFIAEGLRTVETMLAGGMKPLALYVTRQWVDHFIDQASEKILVEVTDEVMKKITQTHTPSGILGIFPLLKKPIHNLTPGIVLTEIADPGNVGTLIRTCAAMGKRAICCIGGVDPWHPKIIQASAGTIAYVDILQGTWEDIVAQRKQLALCALVVESGKSIETLDNKNILWVIGNEATGIPTAWLKDCQDLYTLSMPGKTESLNAAVAGSIAMYYTWALTKN